MTRNRAGLFSLTAAALMMAVGTAGAQGKSQGKSKGATKATTAQATTAKGQAAKGKNATILDGRTTTRGGTVVRDPRDVYEGRTVYGNGTKVPPGLAKKPGQMPPGQYKKYSTRHGATVLGDVFGRHGYDVQRITPYGESQYVYYRRPDGTLARAVVNQGTDRLRFSGVPSTLLREVLSRLY